MREIVGQKRPFHGDSRQDRACEDIDGKRCGHGETTWHARRQADGEGDHPGHGREEAEGYADQSESGVHLVVPLRAFTRFGWAAM